ncbi:ankyrin repeat domain-containing protein [Ignatzschineria sp. LJL83]
MKDIHLFHQAAIEGDIPTLKKGLASGININTTNKQLRTAILMASMHQQYETVQFLIDAGADINLQDETCFNPFLWGCLNDDLKLVQIMIKAKPDLTVLTRFGGVGITPAAEKGHLEIVKELLEKTDINFNHTNFVGWTPLLEAIVLNDGGARQQEIIRLLLSHGANPNMTDMYGKTPLFLAKEKGYKEIADLLVAAGGK